MFPWLIINGVHIETIFYFLKLFSFEKVHKHMKSPIHVYYQLDNFYQNHRRYVITLSFLASDTIFKSFKSTFTKWGKRVLLWKKDILVLANIYWVGGLPRNWCLYYVLFLWCFFSQTYSQVYLTVVKFYKPNAKLIFQCYSILYIIVGKSRIAVWNTQGWKCHNGIVITAWTILTPK